MGQVYNSVTGSVGGSLIQAGNLPSVVIDQKGSVDTGVHISELVRIEIVELLDLLADLGTRKSARAEALAEDLRDR